MKSARSKSNKYRYHTDQSWSCLGCGKCCTMWDIPVTKAEKERLESLDIPGFDFKHEQFFIPMKKRSNLFLIRKKDDRCIFLDTEDGLCIIHKLHGEAVKALACRLYPFHILKWSDGVVSASFRFDCTAVSRNHGKKITARKNDIAGFVPELEKSGTRSKAVFSHNCSPPLENLRTLALSFNDILSEDEIPLPARLHYASTLSTFYSAPENRHFVSEIKKGMRSDTIKYLKENVEDFEYVIEDAPEVDKLTAMVFNYILTGYVRVDEETKDKFFAGRISRINSVLPFLLGRGSLKKISPSYPDTSGISAIQALKESVIEWEAMSLLKRYIGVQLEAMHFCGNPGLNLTFEEGIRHILLFIPITAAIAALHAKTSGRQHPEGKIVILLEDMINAVNITDHTFYHSPFFTLRHVKKMTKWLLEVKRFPSILKLMTH